MKISILYQDDDLIVVDKPIGLPVHSDDGDTGADNVVSLLKKQEALSYLGIHHRLDREVSGVLVFSKRKSANVNLAAVFENRLAVKEYVAIVRGQAPKLSGVVDDALVEASDGMWRVARSYEKGLTALTRYRVEKQTPEYAVLKLKLETGRTHQLRIHLAHIRCPIVGDTLYGVSGETFPRLLLHAQTLSFDHPTTGIPLKFDAPRPAIFQKAVLESELPKSLSLVALRKTEQDVLAEMLALAASRREPFDDDTTAYRLINGAGDGLPGVTLDRYGKSLVLNFYEPNLNPDNPAYRFLLTKIARQWPTLPIYAKFRPRQSSDVTDLQTVAPPEPLIGTAQPEVMIKEDGVNYLIKPGDGLSTGLFLDMREMRSRLIHWVKDKTVLNCFSYTGAFGLVAKLNGAGRVINLDASNRNLEWAKQNYKANGLEPDDYDFVGGDVFDWLSRFARRKQTFDLVILDPPSYSTVKKKRWAVDKNYDELIALAVPLVSPGGMLIACTNHVGISRKIFRQTVLEAVGRQVQIVGYYHESELDFPRIGQTEAYLKVLALKL